VQDEFRTYEVVRAPAEHPLTESWNAPLWNRVPSLAVDRFRPESSDHRPRVEARVAHTADRFIGIFRVEDRYVRCVQTAPQARVCTDSCVECFLKPKPESGHLNFEFNCGGAIRTSYITKPVRTPDGFEEYEDLSLDEIGTIEVRTSMPQAVEPEIETPVTWTLAFAIPIALLEAYVGPIGDPAGQDWRANFYKCGDETSHPHWAAWSPVREFDFHRPQDFGVLRFAK